MDQGLFFLNLLMENKEIGCVYGLSGELLKLSMGKGIWHTSTKPNRWKCSLYKTCVQKAGNNLGKGGEEPEAA